MRLRVSILVLGLLATVCTTQAQLSTTIVQTNDVSGAGRSGALIRFPQANTVTYDGYVMNDTNVTDVTSAAFPVWFIVDPVTRLFYLAQTGSVISATGGHWRVSLDQNDSNLPEGLYESEVILYTVTNGTNIAIWTVARNPVEVLWSAQGTNYTQVGGIHASNLVFNITLTQTVNIGGTSTNVIFENLDANGDVGFASNQVARGSAVASRIESNTAMTLLSGKSDTGHTHTGADITDGSISNADLAVSSVTSNTIADGTILQGDASAAANTAWTNDRTAVVIAGDNVTVTATTNGNVVTYEVDGSAGGGGGSGTVTSRYMVASALGWGADATNLCPISFQTNANGALATRPMDDTTVEVIGKLSWLMPARFTTNVLTRFLWSGYATNAGSCAIVIRHRQDGLIPWNVVTTAAFSVTGQITNLNDFGFATNFGWAANLYTEVEVYRDVTGTGDTTGDVHFVSGGFELFEQ